MKASTITDNLMGPPVNNPPSPLEKVIRQAISEHLDWLEPFMKQRLPITCSACGKTATNDYGCQNGRLFCGPCLAARAVPRTEREFLEQKGL